MEQVSLDLHLDSGAKECFSWVHCPLDCYLHSFISRGLKSKQPERGCSKEIEASSSVDFKKRVNSEDFDCLVVLSSREAYYTG